MDMTGVGTSFTQCFAARQVFISESDISLLLVLTVPVQHVVLATRVFPYPAFNCCIGSMPCPHAGQLLTAWIRSC